MTNNFKNGLGSLFSIPDLRDYVGTSSEAEFPSSFKLTMPAVKDQGSVGSCVAHAISLVTEYYHKKETNETLKMSTGYIYGNRLLTHWKGSGMYTRDAIKTTVKFGNVPKTLFKENIEVPQAINLFTNRYDALEEKGVPFRFKEYFKLKDEAAIKTALLEGNPVIFSMVWFNDIEIIDGVMQTTGNKTKGDGGHCMVIYGWDERGWLVQNSWGTSWGNKGRFVMPYNVPTKEFWGIRDVTEEDSKLVVHKPFKSKFGKELAKILNNIILCFYRVFKE